MEHGDSPVACTQEASNDVDVVWDWNSPQAKQQPRRTHKRLILTRSPKIPLKRHPSNNQIQNFEKLREELKILKEAISVPDNEESLILSPVQEEEYKNVTHFQDDEVIPSHDNFQIQDDDLFNDSVNEQLILFSQKIESELSKSVQVTDQLFSNNKDQMSNIKNISGKGFSEISRVKEECEVGCAKTNNEIKYSDVRNIECDTNKIADDSFDNILETFKTEANEAIATIFDRTITKEEIKSKHIFSPVKSKNNHKIIQPTSGKVEFHRTQSFESTLEHAKAKIPQSKLDEIERKRKEALAKLEFKRKQGGSDTPIKCTPQEIEQKRLQALAKRDAKRQQDEIERKRKEALKRLELSRKKNATNVKSSLTKRL